MTFSFPTGVPGYPHVTFDKGEALASQFKLMGYLPRPVLLAAMAVLQTVLLLPDLLMTGISFSLRRWMYNFSGGKAFSWYHKVTMCERQSTVSGGETDSGLMLYDCLAFPWDHLKGEKRQEKREHSEYATLPPKDSVL